MFVCIFNGHALAHYYYYFGRRKVNEASVIKIFFSRRRRTSVNEASTSSVEWLTGGVLVRVVFFSPPTRPIAYSNEAFRWFHVDLFAMKTNGASLVIKGGCHLYANEQVKSANKYQWAESVG